MPIFVRMNPHGALPIRKRRGGTVGRLTLMVGRRRRDRHRLHHRADREQHRTDHRRGRRVQDPGVSARPPDVDDARDHDHASSRRDRDDPTGRHDDDAAAVPARASSPAARGGTARRAHLAVRVDLAVEHAAG